MLRPEHQPELASAGPGLRVTVLGVTGVVGTDRRLVSLPGERCRLLLAALACRADRNTPTDLLIDALWGEQPPRSSYANLQTYVWRIRQALSAAEPGGGERLVYQSGTYRLHLDANSCDLLELQALHRRAVDSIRQTARLPDALPLLDRAYALWSGRPFSVVAAQRSTTVAGEQHRCEELYLRLCEDRFDVALDCGAAVDVVSTLRRLISEFPLRERLHALLMRALADRGEQASALVAYRDARAVLARELGAEPGPELRRLHLKLLRPAPAENV
jgi:DNA-binding SARP family transcriptional activator